MARVRAYGTPAKLGTKSISDNGIYPASYDGLDGFSQVDVSVIPLLSIKMVDQNGTYKASDDHVDGYSQVVVTVPEKTLGTKSITANGTYNASSDNVDGYSQVVVNVSGGSLTPTTLWTNSNIYNTFNDQDIILSDDIDNYTYIGITYQFNNSEHASLMTLMTSVSDLKKMTYTGSVIRPVICLAGSNPSGVIFTRLIWYVDDTTLHVSLGYRVANTQTFNNVIIPLNVIGYA